MPPGDELNERNARAEAVAMHTYGNPKISFAEPRSTQWAMFILGLALLVAGGIVLLVFALQGMSTSMRGSDLADVIGGGVFLGILVLGGAVAAVVGLRDLMGAPEWHVSATHAYRTRGAKVVRSIVLREQPAPTLRKYVRYGQLISVHVMFGRSVIVVPSMDVANGFVDAWRNAKG